MARGLDSDYIGSISLMDGFDMRVNFDGFGENMKKFMELPIKYLDSAHDKAVGLVEDIHALIYAPCPDNELSNKGQRTSMDPSSSNPIAGCPPTSAEREQANPDEEVSSSPSSLLTAEDSSLCSTDSDAHETESVSSKSPVSCTLEDTISIEGSAGTKEEIILCSSENLPDRCTPENCNSLVRTVSSEDEIILWNPGKAVKPPQPPVLIGMITANGEEQSGLYTTNSHEESAKHGLFSGADDPIMLADEMTDFVDIDLQDGQERTEYDKAEASLVPKPRNTSFKKVLMRSLSNKLRWSKKDMNVHQAASIRPHKAETVRYEVVSSSVGLEDDWELL